MVQLEFRVSFRARCGSPLRARKDTRNSSCTITRAPGVHDLQAWIIEVTLVPRHEPELMVRDRPPCLSCRTKNLDLGGETAPEAVLFGFEVVPGLEVHPELVRGPEVPGQSKRRVSTDSTVSMDDLVDPPSWDADVLRESVLADAQGTEKLLEENFPGMDRSQLLGHLALLALVVVHDFDVRSIPVPPDEADPPLIVDPNTVATSPVAAQFLQPVGRRYRQIFQTLRRIQHDELAKRCAMKTGRKSPGVPALEHLFRFAAPKALDHSSIVTLGVKEVHQPQRMNRIFHATSPRWAGSPIPVRALDTMPLEFAGRKMPARSKPREPEPAKVMAGFECRMPWRGVRGRRAAVRRDLRLADWTMAIAKRGS